MVSLHKLLVVGSCIATLALGLDAVPGTALRGVLKESNHPAAVEMSSGDSTVALLKSPFGMAFGVALGTAMMAFAGRSIKRTKDEQKRIQQLFDENTSAQQLQSMADAGTPLPSLVIIRGVVSADGVDVQGVSPMIEGIKTSVGHIDQPDNAYLSIARMAKASKNDPNMKRLTDKVAEQTGIKPEDVPDVPDDFTHAQRNFEAGTPLILSEILVDRLSGSVSETEKKNDNGSKTVTITRKCRDQSYTCFYGRKMADGLHLLDMQGGRIDLRPPSAELLPQFSPVHHGEAPPLFLATANVREEFFSFLRKEGLTVRGNHLDFSNLPPSTITSPSTHLSKFVFIDAQSTTDAGMYGGNGRVLHSISEAYGNKAFLWEPRGFYDKDYKGKDNVATYAADPKSEMVSAGELMAKAGRAAEINSRMTPYCEPTFARHELRSRRDQENCFRVTELAIARGCDVTVLAMPVKNPAGKVTLVAPNSAEDGADADNPDSQRYRFRILKGHTVENLLKQRSLNIMQYYGFAVVGAFLTVWAAAGYPGLTARS